MLKSTLVAVAAIAAAGSALAEPVYFFGQNASGFQNKARYGDNKAHGHYVQSGSAKIYYETYGKGSPVVLLHGGMVGSIGEMGELIEHLQGSHFVIAVATRGHGKSYAGEEEPSYGQKVRDVQAVLAQQNIQQAVDIIGFSDGAYTGLQFALANPQKLRKLVAIGAGEWIKGVRTFGKEGFAQFVKLDERYWQQQQKIRPEPAKTEEWYGQVSKYYNGFEMKRADFAKITTPTLMLAGEKDQNAPLDTVLAAYGAMPKANLAIVANAPHTVLQTDFAASWAMIDKFLHN